MSGAYLIGGSAAGYDAFQARALDPQTSVVISACAGAGKTTMLVGRIVRALLEGCEPDTILAVTFTRKAAAEMRARLMDTLRELALGDDASALELLQRFALPPTQARRSLAAARGLYECVLTHPRGPTVATFHSWFWQLARLAPLASGAPLDANLSEDDAMLADEARLDWLARLREPAHSAVHADLCAVIEQLGERRVDDALQAALRRRVELLVALDEPMRADAAHCACAAARLARDALAGLAEAVARWRESEPGADRIALSADEGSIACALRSVPGLRAELLRFARLLALGGAGCRSLAARIEGALAALDDRTLPLEQVAQAVSEAVLTRAGTARAWCVGGRGAAAFVRALGAGGGEQAWRDAWQALAARVASWNALAGDLCALQINLRLMRVTADRIAHFQAFKRTRRVVDFGDVELMAAQLVRDEPVAAFVQARLDARYTQLLFDEFQDTNALQWRVVSDWLSSYAGAGPRPAVCIVGDAKQAIYRFRRADSRVFDAARTLLVRTFGATDLTTDTTWRIAPAVLECIDACMSAPGVPLLDYRRHATRRDDAGFAWRLPLADGDDASVDDTVPGDEDDLAPAAGAVQAPDPAVAFLRDWFVEPRERDVRHRHFVEGTRIARAILAARERMAAAGRPVRWKDILVLARRRTHFARYKHALRSAGIPVVSDRTGGLLDRLEISDLLSVLRWLWQPADDLALAQVLKSPLFGVDEAALALLARDRGMSWWERLERASAAASPIESLRDAHAQLGRWLASARTQPVHELLDRVIADRDAYARYAAVVPPSQREVVRANLDAFLALSLDTDGARWPSLPTFLDAVRRIRRASEHDAPSEGTADGVDAVQLMTIHGAKGLEAEIVVLADANGAVRNESGWRPLVGWNPLEQAPRHVSFVRDSNHPSRLAWLREEARLVHLEDWNLLYVALTRARSGLIVSGARNDRAAPGNWYARLRAVPELDPDIDGVAASAVMPAAAMSPAAVPGAWSAELVWRQYRPEPLGVGVRSASTDARRRARDLADALQRCIALLTMDASTAQTRAPLDRTKLHAALERTTLDAPERTRVVDLACRIADLPGLGRCFDGSARSEGPVDVIDASGQLLTIDRWVELEDESWIVDWKAAIDASWARDARARLSSYRAAMLEMVSDKPVRTVLVDASAQHAALDADLA